MTLSISQLKDKLTELGLIIGDKPVSFREFKERLQSIGYTRGKYPLRIHLLGKPKENLFGFYPYFKDTKAAEIREAYAMYVMLVAGYSSDYANDAIQWGNSGIPIGYGDLRYTEWNRAATNELVNDLFNDQK